MKNVKIILGALLCVVLFSTTGYADEIKSTSEKEKKASIDALRNQIVYIIGDVDFENDMDVYVRFSVSNEKKLVVNDVSCTDIEFAKTIKAKLEKCRIKSLSTPNSAYLIKIRFLKNRKTQNDVVTNNNLLRSLFLEYLLSVSEYNKGSVMVKFAVKEGVIVLKKVEGADANLVKSVETELTKSKIEVPGGINGIYRVKVTF